MNVPKTPKQMQDTYVPDLGVLRQRQIEFTEKMAEMEQEVEIFRRVLAMAVQKLGGTLVVTDEEMLGWEWEHNTLEMDGSEEEPRVTITSFQV